jgi:mannitol/fructose-specific phosphotransferase system IIA component (Ntr-type)
MGIILGLLALQFGVIDQRVFVALVATALTTSVLSGPAMQIVLRLKKPRRFFSFMSAKTFLQPLESSARKDAIHTLALTIAEAHDLDRRDVEREVLKRERLMATGIGNEVAVPHARLRDLEQPIVALGISPAGIDFDAPDGKPAHFIFLLLTPEDDNGAQLEILADISRTFKDPQLRLETLAELGYTHFIALVKSVGEKS